MGDKKSWLDDKLYSNDDNIASMKTNGNQCWFNNNKVDKDEDDNDDNNYDDNNNDDYFLF